MAIDFPASPTLNQTFSVGNTNYVWDGTKWTASVTGGIALDKIQEGNTSAEVVDTGSDGRFVVTTEGTERLRVDSSGRVGIGTTSPDTRLHVSVPSSTYTYLAKFDNPTKGTSLTFGSPALDTQFLLPAKAGDSVIRSETGNIVIGTNDDTKSILFGSQNSSRATIDSSGRLLVGTSTSFNHSNNTQSRLQVEGAPWWGASIGIRNTDAAYGTGPYLHLTKTRGSNQELVSSGDQLGTIFFNGSDGANALPGAAIGAIVDGTPGANDMPGRLVFSVTRDGSASPTEALRIDNAGRIDTFANETGLLVWSAAAAGTIHNLLGGINSASGPKGSGALCFRVYTNGNVENTNNSYGAISDVKLKENIVDAGSQWSDIKALQVRNYNLKEGQTHRQIGLIAQEVEPISPGLVYESPDRDAEGNDLGTVTKSVNYSVLYMKAVKALQEAMERIETLEAKVAALESA